MGTCRTKVTILGVSVDISEDRMGSFFTKYSEVSEVKALMSKANIATGDMELYITVNRKNFQEIPNILVCRDKKKRSAPVNVYKLHLVQQRKHQQQQEYQRRREHPQ